MTSRSNAVWTPDEDATFERSMAVPCLFLASEGFFRDASEPQADVFYVWSVMTFGVIMNELLKIDTLKLNVFMVQCIHCIVFELNCESVTHTRL